MKKLHPIRRKYPRTEKHRRKHAARLAACSTVPIEVATAIEMTIRMVNQDRMLDIVSRALELANVELERLRTVEAQYRKLWTSGREPDAMRLADPERQGGCKDL